MINLNKNRLKIKYIKYIKIYKYSVLNNNNNNNNNEIQFNDYRSWTTRFITS